jgi:hypothetical protein
VSRHLTDVHATDLSLSAISERRALLTDDPALQALASWAADIDARPVTIAVDPPEPNTLRRTSRHALRSAVAIAAALALSSGGIAAAVKGDPFAPIGYMVDRFGGLGGQDRTPDDGLFGSRRSPHDLLALRQERARQAHRPSRDGRFARAAQPTSGGTAEQPLVASRQRAGSGDGSAPTRSKAARLPVRSASSGAGSTADGPKPGSGQTPPVRPEPVPYPSGSTWPKPLPGAEPVPPDEPLPSPISDAPATVESG